MKEPSFCSKCGKALLTSDKIGEYDVFTGDKVIVSKTFRCPDYNRLLGRFHYNITMRFDTTNENIDMRH